MTEKEGFEAILMCLESEEEDFWKVLNLLTTESIKRLEGYNEEVFWAKLNEVYESDRVKNIYLLGRACCDWDRELPDEAVKPIEDFGIMCLEKAVAGGNKNAMLDLALILTYYERYFTSYPISELFYGACQDGDEFAKKCFVAECKALSVLLSKKLKFPLFCKFEKKFNIALCWYAKTKYDMLINSENGDADAQFDYAFAMMHNEFFRKDEEKIVKLLKSSAEKGNEKAERLLKIARRKYFIFND